MDALQADASSAPDDSVEHVANSLVNMQVTAPAAVTVPASTPFDPANRSATAAVPATSIVPASTLGHISDSFAAAVQARDSTAPEHEDVGRPRVDPSSSRCPRVAQRIASLVPVFALRSVFLLVSFDRG
jgi:hypothetical protein